jgi:uncharacterized protein
LRLTKLCVNHPKLVIAAIVVATIVFGWFAGKVERDHSMERLLPKDEPIRAFFEEFRNHFNLKTGIALGISHPQGVFSPEVLTQVDRLSGQLAKIPHIDLVRSLTTIENITAEDGIIAVGKLSETIPATSEEAAEFERAASANPMLLQALVSKDRTATLISVQPDYFPYETEKAIAGHKAVQAVIDADPGPGEIFVAGFPTVVALINQYMNRDNRVMLPLVALTVIFLLWLCFRSIRGVWIPLFVVVAAVIWTFGMLGLVGLKITIISTSIPIVLVAMGIADGIHVISEYYHHLRDGMQNKDAVVATMGEMNGPVVMTSLTTAAGFGALASSPIIPIREYGAAVAFGILAAMVVSLVFIPAVLIVLGAPKRIPEKRADRPGMLDRFSRILGRFAVKKARAILAAFLLGLVVTGILSTFITVRNNPVMYFRPWSEIRKADKFINEKFVGTGELLIQVDGKSPAAIKDPDLLEKIAELERRFEAIPLVGTATTIVDYLSRMNYVLADQDPLAERLPGTKLDLGESWTPEAGKAKVGQFLLLYEMSGGEDLYRSVDFPYQRANLHLHVTSNNSDDYKRIMDKVLADTAEVFPDGSVNIGITGAGAINLKVVQYLVFGQISSLALSLVIVFFMLAFLFKSWVDAAIGMIPLAITVTANFAVMAVGQIPLNMGTALIASVIIGVGVDYSIHLIHRFRLEQKRNGRFDSAMEVTMDTSGRAIGFNALAVGGGFAVLAFSSFRPVVYLGLLVPYVMVVNAVAALVVIPACLSLLDERRAKRIG